VALFYLELGGGRQANSTFSEAAEGYTMHIQRIHKGLIFFALALIAAALAGCAKMQLMETMAKSNEPNELMSGQMFAVGGGAEAEVGDDGVARVTVSWPHGVL
jgi:hypothetical protein